MFDLGPDPYMQGCLAARNGLSVEDCPHDDSRDPWSANAWRAGLDFENRMSILRKDKVSIIEHIVG